MPAYFDEKTKTWFCKFYYTDYTGTKRQKKKRGFKLQREAKEWERAFLERQQGSPDMTFRALCDIYMEDAQHRLREDTVANKEHIFRNHILPYFGSKPVNTITPSDIRAWQNHMLGKDLSPGYLRHVQAVLSAALNYAVRYHDLPSNPCHKAGQIGEESRSMAFWTLDQYNSFIPYIEDIRAKTAFQLLFYSGMRFGEVMALTLEDLDFQTGVISVTKTFHKRTKTIGPPKTKNSVRRIAMPSAIMDELQVYVDKIYGLRPSDLIFTFTESLLRGNIKRGSVKAGVPRIRIHDLRHSHVSLLINMGCSPYLIAERIGDTIEMVNRIYGHLYPDRHGEVAERLDQIIVPR